MSLSSTGLPNLFGGASTFCNMVAHPAEMRQDAGERRGSPPRKQNTVFLRNFLAHLVKAEFLLVTGILDSVTSTDNIYSAWCL